VPREVPRRVLIYEHWWTIPKESKACKVLPVLQEQRRPPSDHNTNECCKYDKDGNPIAKATGKPLESKKPFKKGGNKQMAFLMASIKSLVKKGIKKAAKSKK
jgi:hypothetical protein